MISTLTALTLCSTHHPKLFSLVSSTAVLDNEYFVRVSDESIQAGGRGLSESDDLEGSRTGLGSGYGQSKWVAEKLVMEASKRGLAGWIVRPGYVVGDSKTAVTNTDDFIWRLVKGCVQLGLIPDINNTINMVPVDHVALLTSLSALSTSPQANFNVAHVTARPLIRFNELLSSLSTYGYPVERCDYLVWRRKLEQHVLEVQDNALFPLLHFVLDDLPTSTKSADLDDTNAQALAVAGGEKPNSSVGDAEMGRYLSWLIKAGFMDAPPAGAGAPLPELQGDARAIGRTTAGK